MLKPPILHYIKTINAQSVLDIGCGNGAMLRDLSPVCPIVAGLDASESGIRGAKENCPSGTFYTLSVYDSPEKIEKSDFDLVISTEVVEHLFYPAALPKFAHAKLRKNGLFLVSTPYHGWLKNVAIAVLNKWDSHHTLFWDGGHIKFWSRATLSQLLEDSGFEIIGFHGCGRAPYLWESMILVGRKR